MTRQQVNSSQIVSVGYNPALSVLEIEFQSGQVHQYAGVSQSIYAGMITANSPGSYFYANIKGRYRETQVS